MTLLVVRVKYSDDQPRVPAGESDGGQFTSGGGSGSGGGVDKPVSATGRRGKFKVDLPALHQEAKLLGLSAKKLIVREKADSNRSLPEGLHGAQLAGYFDNRTGTVTLFLGSHRSQEELLGTLRHEVTHAQFERAYRKSPAVEEFLMWNRRALKEEGEHVTNYTTAFWKMAGTGSINKDAVNESIAEQRRIGSFTPTYAKLMAVVLQNQKQADEFKRVDAVAAVPVLFFLNGTQREIVPRAEAEFCRAWFLKGDGRVQIYALPTTKTIGDLVRASL